MIFTVLNSIRTISQCIRRKKSAYRLNTWCWVIWTLKPRVHYPMKPNLSKSILTRCWITNIPHLWNMRNIPLKLPMKCLKASRRKFSLKRQRNISAATLNQSFWVKISALMTLNISPQAIPFWVSTASTICRWKLTLKISKSDIRLIMKT